MNGHSKQREQCARAKRPEQASCVLGASCVLETRSELALLKHNTLEGRSVERKADTR